MNEYEMNNEEYDRKVYVMVKQIQCKCFDDAYIDSVWDFMFGGE